MGAPETVGVPGVGRQCLAFTLTTMRGKTETERYLLGLNDI